MMMWIFPFPQASVSIGEMPEYLHLRGMTLRDYFAGQALAGFLASWPESGMPRDLHSWPQLAVKSYEAADAMLAKREKG